MECRQNDDVLEDEVLQMSVDESQQWDLPWITGCALAGGRCCFDLAFGGCRLIPDVERHTQV
jgi:hypothetical protein